jgi:hypothetical protein
MRLSPKSERLHNLLIGISLFVISSIISLGLLEGMIRVFFPAYDPSGQVDFVYAGGLTLGPPNQELRQSKNTGDYDVAIRFNDHGFRDAKDVATARSGDIIVVGDSFAFGWGVEESQRFSNVLENLLHRRVFNIAVGSADFNQYDDLLKYAQSLGAQIDDVVIAVCMENDLGLYNVSDQSATDVEKKVATSSPTHTSHLFGTFAESKLWLTHNSATYRMFTTAVQQSPWLKNLAVRTHMLVPNLVGIAKNTYSQEIIERSANRLAEIASRYKHTMILIIPSRALWVGNNRYTEDRVHREFVAALVTRHLNVTDMRKTFEAGGDPLSNHFRNDGHWNPRGHRLAAEMLVRQEVGR